MAPHEGARHGFPLCMKFFFFFSTCFSLYRLSFWLPATTMVARCWIRPAAPGDERLVREVPIRIKGSSMSMRENIGSIRRILCAANHSSYCNTLIFFFFFYTCLAPEAACSLVATSAMKRSLSLFSFFFLCSIFTWDGLRIIWTS